MMSTLLIVRILGIVACVAGIVLCVIVARTRFKNLSHTRTVNLGLVTLPVAAFYKLIAFGAFIVAPGAALAVANWHTFTGVHEVRGCAQCHVMLPMVNDLRDANSDTLAARHYKNRWISLNQCYDCHSDYGFGGNLAAKMEGYRHLVRYTTMIYEEPIKLRGRFDNANCIKCHAGMPKFEAGVSHRTVRDLLNDSSMSCLNCHGRAHPSRAARTPGSPDYKRLMTPFTATSKP